MTWYPQIGAGSIVQFPLSRGRSWRTISNQLESGERISLADVTGGEIAWGLTYADLSDAEAQSLSGLFSASQGSYAAFGFVDPLANLLGWSEDLSHPDWQMGLLTSHGAITDPLETQRAWVVSNPSAGAQALQQTLGVPGAYVACFSAWLRSDAPGAVTLTRDGVQAAAKIGPVWKRFVSGSGSALATQSTFSIVLAAGQTIDVWGLQTEAQPWPSAYKQTAVATGIYEETRFGTDELTLTSEGPGRSSCSVGLISRV